MEFLIFSALIYVIAPIAIVLYFVLRKPSEQPPPAPSKNVYEDAYWKGYQDMGRVVQEQLDADTFDAQAVQTAIDKGRTRGEIKTVSNDTLENELDRALVNAAQIVSPPVQSVQPVDKSDRNLNAMLYMASFLLVAAGAAMLGAALPSIAKLIGVWLLVLAFYGVGLWLYGSSKRLQPAALAFAGTGLALLPFAGVAIHEYGGVDPNIAWLMTSIVGLAAYIFAALKLQNLVVSYLTLAFVLSLASSSVGAASMPIVWHFEAIIAVSLAASLISFIKPTWLPKVFSEPVERTGQVVTPMALVASLFVYSQLSIVGYEIVYLTATAHYIVAWLQTKRYEYEHAARLVAHLTALVFCWDFADGDTVQFGLLFLGLALLQAIYSFVRKRREQQDIWVWGALALELLSLTFWVNSPDMYHYVTLSLLALALTSFGAAYIFRKVILGIPGLFVTFVLPLVAMRNVIDPPLDWGWLAALYVVAATASLAFYYYFARVRSVDFRSFVSSGLVGYLILASIYSGFLDNPGGAFVLLLVAAIAGISSYVYGKPVLILCSTLASTIALIRLWSEYGDSTWQPLGVAWIAGLVYYAASWAVLQYGDNERQKYLLASAWTVLVIGALIEFFDPALNIAAAWTITLVAGTIGIEGYRSKNRELMEIGFYAGSFGLQRVVGLGIPELNIVFYAHWWAIAIAAVAVVRHQLMPRLMIAMGIITAVTGLYALDEGGGYALLFLIEHVALLVAGAVNAKSWAVWWGIIASSLAVLYFLRDVAFLAFGFLGLVVIAVAIWRLMKNTKEEPDHHTPPHDFKPRDPSV